MQEQGDDSDDLAGPVLVLPPLRRPAGAGGGPRMEGQSSGGHELQQQQEAEEGQQQEDEVDEAERDLENSERDIESELLEQLQDLHRQLAEVRQQSKREERERRLFQESSKLIVCANKKPVLRLTRSRDGAWVFDEYKARFKSAIDSLAGTNRVRWVSWPGSHVELGSQEAVRVKMEADYGATPVFLQPDIADLFYNKFCHGVLWPLFHSINTDNFNEGLLESFMEQYEAYHHANQCYLEVVADLYEPGDLVLVLDYELMLLPMLLRKRFPDVVCGFFLHCPFPSSEFYRMLPVRQQLLQGMLGADLVSFNHFDYIRHFLNSCTRLLGLECFPSRVEHNGRLVSLSICPAGIQPEDYDITHPLVQKHVEALSSRYSGHKMIVSMDRLDPCKGLPQKLMAMESLLEHYPEWRGRVVMFAIIRDRNRPEDRELSRLVDGLVGRVNGRFGSCDYCPVNYVKGALMSEEVVALNALADVKLVTSIREGINLGAMEFIACQQHTRHGVLVYSEFAGCCTDFKGALIVNPYDADKVAESIHVALTMSNTAKQIRNHQLSRYVNTYTSALWARRMISSLQQAGQKAREYNQLQRVELPYFQAFYERSRKRLLVLDYDGTLVPYHSLPQLAAPSAEVVSSLEALCEDPANCVLVISGRKREDLQEWLGHIPQLGLLAENGYWCRLPSCMQQAAAESVRGAAGGAGADAMSVRSQTSTARGSPLLTAVSSSTSLLLPQQQQQDSSTQQLLLDDLSLSQHGESDSTGLASLLLSQVGPQYGSSGGLNTNKNNHEESSASAWEWGGWVSKRPLVDLAWKDEVMGILESFTERTPGSFLEVKDSCLAWHYRDADPDFGLSQAKNLHQHLDQMLKHQAVRVITCPIKKYMVIHPSRLNKGRALLQVLQDYGQASSSSTTAAAGTGGVGVIGLAHSASSSSLSGAAAPATTSSSTQQQQPPASSPPVLPLGTPPAPPSVSSSSVEGGGPPSVLDLDFVLVVGDERTDEDMFDILRGSTGFAIRNSKGSKHVSKFVPSTARGHCFTVTVGRKMSRAQYYVDDPKDVKRLLMILADSTRATLEQQQAQQQQAGGAAVVPGGAGGSSNNASPLLVGGGPSE